MSRKDHGRRINKILEDHMKHYSHFTPEDHEEAANHYAQTSDHPAVVKDALKNAHRNMAHNMRSQAVKLNTGAVAKLSHAQQIALLKVHSMPEGSHHVFDSGTGSDPEARKHGIAPTTIESLVKQGYLEYDKSGGDTVRTLKFKKTARGEATRQKAEAEPAAPAPKAEPEEPEHPETSSYDTSGAEPVGRLSSGHTLHNHPDLLEHADKMMERHRYKEDAIRNNAKANREGEDLAHSFVGAMYGKLTSEQHHEAAQFHKEMAEHHGHTRPGPEDKHRMSHAESLEHEWLAAAHKTHAERKGKKK